MFKRLGCGFIEKQPFDDTNFFQSIRSQELKSVKQIRCGSTDFGSKNERHLPLKVDSKCFKLVTRKRGFSLKIICGSSNPVKCLSSGSSFCVLSDDGLLASRKNLAFTVQNLGKTTFYKSYVTKNGLLLRVPPPTFFFFQIASGRLRKNNWPPLNLSKNAK